jgi:ABC-2 type transport system ATP-binding protein
VPAGDGFEFEVPAEGIEPVLVRLIDSGHGVAGLSVERPGLHEAFVKLVRDVDEVA